MHYLLGRFQIYVEEWKTAIQAEAAHKKAGLHFKQVWRNVDNPREIFFLFEIEGLQRARSFLQEAGAYKFLPAPPLTGVSVFQP